MLLSDRSKNESIIARWLEATGGLNSAKSPADGKSVLGAPPVSMNFSG